MSALPVAISSLPAAEALDGSERFPVVQAGQTRQAALPGLDPTVGIVLSEISTGEWSGDIPARTTGANPVEARGWSDPLGVDGVDTPENWQPEHDIWVVKTAPA